MDDLVEAIYFRDYEMLESVADSVLQSQGWKGLRKLLLKIPISKKIRAQKMPDFFKENMVGKKRDAIVYLLGLEPTNGIDFDMLELFKDIEATSVEKLRNAVFPIANDALIKQIKRRNTFFMDVEKIAASRYAHLVDDIVKSRNEEILELKGDLTPTIVLGKYYAYKVLTAGGIMSIDQQRALPEVVEVLQSILSEIGSSAIMQIEKPIATKNTFKDCSRNLSVLLVSCARISMNLMWTNVKKIVDLVGQKGDSRALSTIHQKMDSLLKDSDKLRVTPAMQNLGSRKSVDRLIALYDSFPRSRKSIISVLGGIRSTESVDFLLSLMKDKKFGESAILSLEKLMSKSALSSMIDYFQELENVSVSRNVDRLSLLSRAIINTGIDGESFILQNVQTVIEILENCSESHILLDKLFFIRNLDSKLLIDFLDMSLRRASKKTSTISPSGVLLTLFNRETDSSRLNKYLVRNRRIIDTIIETTSDIKNLIELIDEFPVLLNNQKIIDRVIDLVELNPLENVIQVPRVPELIFHPRMKEILESKIHEVVEEIERASQFLRTLRKYSGLRPITTHSLVRKAVVKHISKRNQARWIVKEIIDIPELLEDSKINECLIDLISRDTDKPRSGYSTELLESPTFRKVLGTRVVEQNPISIRGSYFEDVNDWINKQILIVIQKGKLTLEILCAMKESQVLDYELITQQLLSESKKIANLLTRNPDDELVENALTFIVSIKGMIDNPDIQQALINLLRGSANPAPYFKILRNNPQLQEIQEIQRITKQRFDDDTVLDAAALIPKYRVTFPEVLMRYQEILKDDTIANTDDRTFLRIEASLVDGKEQEVVRIIKDLTEERRRVPVYTRELVRKHFFTNPSIHEMMSVRKYLIKQFERKDGWIDFGFIKNSLRDLLEIPCIIQDSSVRRIILERIASAQRTDAILQALQGNLALSKDDRRALFEDVFQHLIFSMDEEPEKIYSYYRSILMSPEIISDVTVQERMAMYIRSSHKKWEDIKFAEKCKIFFNSSSMNSLFRDLLEEVIRILSYDCYVLNYSPKSNMIFARFKDYKIREILKCIDVVPLWRNNKKIQHELKRLYSVKPDLIER